MNPPNKTLALTPVKACRRAYMRDWVKRNYESQKTKRHAYYVENREVIRRKIKSRMATMGKEINRRRSEIYFKNRDSEREKRRVIYSKNRDSILEKLRVWRSENPVEYKAIERAKKLKATYGMTVGDYAEMSESQKHACAICGVPASELKRPLCVDHDHSTGKIRALICTQCNAGLGYFKDNPAIMKKAINYLHEHSTNENTSQQSSPSVCPSIDGIAPIG